MSALPLLVAALALGQAPPVPEVPLPIDDVVVYSDRARVTRSGEVPLKSGLQRIRLPLLPVGIDPSSVQLVSQSATVGRVEVRRADLNEFPRGKAEELIHKLESAGDAAGAIDEKIASIDGERNLLAGVRPASTPFQPYTPPVTLETAGWRVAQKFFEARIAALDAQRQGLEAKRRAAQKDLAQLQGEAQQLLAGQNGRPGYVVEAVVEGRGGNAKLSLVYMAMNARWYPAYDVRYTPGKNEVELDFAGLVSQQTGEDWTDAALTLSTAVPATTIKLPKLLAWKIGDRDRFIPTPVAQPEAPLPPPPAPAVPPRIDRTDDETVKNALRNAIAQAPQGSSSQVAIDQLRQQQAQQQELQRRRYEEMDRKQAEMKARAPMEYESDEVAGEMAKEDAEEAPMPPPAPPRAYEPSRPSAAPMAPSAGAAMPTTESVTKSRGKNISSDSGSYGTPVTFQVPVGYRAPSYSWDLPASLAGGYDFTYASARRESVRSGAQARRVALHAARFPAQPMLSIYPALKKAAYLVAEITNTSDKPLLRGQANLFVGADLQGRATLETTARGEKFTLPLGIDEGIKVERNVNVVTRETGLISKKDVTAYETKIELVNPHRGAMKAKVFDQIPLKGTQELEVALEKTEPWAIQDQPMGSLEWDITLPAGGKQVLSFTYTLTRPRNARLYQW